MLRITTGPKFARHIHPSFSGEPEARCCGATTGVQGHLGNDARSCVSGETANRGMRLSGSGAVSNHGALQGIPKAGTESDLFGWVIEEVFMKRCRDRMLNCRFYDACSESCPNTLAKSLDSSAVVSRVAQQLTDSSLRDHPG